MGNDVKRRFELRIELSADDRQTLQRRLEDMVWQLGEVSGKYSSVGGGYSSGHIITIEENPEQTHEKWEQDLEAYLAARRADSGKDKP